VRAALQRRVDLLESRAAIRPDDFGWDLSPLSLADLEWLENVLVQAQAEGAEVSDLLGEADQARNGELAARCRAVDRGDDKLQG
jgi:hypothetical protein